MKFSQNDITFDSITPNEFENLCYDILVKYNYKNVIWRKGGADSGRDIEAYLLFENSISNIDTKWFIECKHYKKGVPPTELNSKITWADAENPDFLVFMVSSYITQGARDWLSKIASSKPYQIVCIEGDELKNRITKYPDLVEQYFSLNKYLKLFSDLKNYKVKYNINPSFEVLNEIIQNIDLTKLDLEDFGFILINFHNQHKLFEARNDHYGDFDKSIIDRITKYLISTIKNEDSLKSFEPYKNDYDELGGVGFFEEMYWLKESEDVEHMEHYQFQIYDLHLNHLQDRDNWKIGYYLIIIYESCLIELFKVEKTEIRVIKDFTPEKLNELSIRLPYEIQDYLDYEKYFEK